MATSVQGNGPGSARHGKADLMDEPKVLVPYNPREAIALRQAAKIAGRSESTVRTWCALYHIGRLVVGGPWQISRAALAMLLDGNEAALRAYSSGDRRDLIVEAYLALSTKAAIEFSHTASDDGKRANVSIRAPDRGCRGRLTSS